MSTLFARVFARLTKGRGPAGRPRICKAAASDAFAKCIQSFTATTPQLLAADSPTSISGKSFLATVTPTSTTPTLSLTSILALTLLLTSLAATTHADNAAIYTRRIGINVTTPTTELEVSGTISATRFVGDGSLLTGISAGSVSTGASGSIVYRDATGNLIASSTLTISSTTGSVAIGGGAASWLGSNGLYAYGHLRGEGIYANSWFYLMNNGYGVTWPNGTEAVTGDGSIKYLAFKTSGTEGLRIVSSGYVGIGTTAPSATLDVNGRGYIGTGANRGSASGYALLVDGGLGVYGGNQIELNAGGVRTWFSASGIDMNSGSIQNYKITNTNGARLAINTYATPSATLHVSGTLVATSWTSINTNAASTAPLEVSGTVSATRFVGDGSLLTGIVGASSGDNIASGTTKVTTNQTGYISFTTAGTTTGYMDTAGNFILPGVSTTSSVSASALFSSGRVVVGPTPVGVNNSNTLEVSGTVYTQYTGLGDTSGSTSTAAMFMQVATGTDLSPHNIGLAVRTLRDRDASSVGWHYTTTRLTRVVDTSTAKQNWISFMNRSASSDNAMAFGEGASEEWMRIDNGKVGVGTQTPTTPLEVSGTISGTTGAFGSDGSSLSIGTGGNNSVYGTYNGRAYVGYGNSDAVVQGGAGKGIRFIVSNTSFASATSVAGRFDPSGNFGLGSAAPFSPSQTLHVGGSALITSWTGINFSGSNVTPTAPLEVSGTISATRFVGDGSLLTGIVGASSGDNIASGTTRVTANTTGYVSFTTGGTTTGYMDGAGNFVLPGVSTTGRISATSFNSEIIPLRDLSDVSASSSLGSLYIGAGVGITGSQSATENVGIGSVMFSSASMTGSANTGMGRYVMQNLSTGSRNTAIGRAALWQVTTGTDNTAIGFANLLSNLAGVYNTSVGSSAASNMSDGSYNVMMGGFAAGNTDTASQSVFIGAQAGLGISGTTTALTNEVMVGYRAGYGITTGGYNTFLGSNAGSNVTVGGGNIMIGANTSAPVATGSSQLNIGNLIYASGLVAASNIGSGVGKVGINYVTPSVALEVSGTVSATRFIGDGSLLTGIVGASSGDNIASGTTRVTANTTGYISFTTGGTTTGYMDTAGKFIVPGVSSTGPISGTDGYFSGNVGIGAAPNASYGLYVNSPTYVNNMLYSSMGLTLNSAGPISLRFLNVNTNIGGDGTNKYITFTTSGTEAMRIVSTGYVGIGTTDPSTSLDIVAPNNGTNYIRLLSTHTGSNVRSRLILANSSSTYALLQLAGSNYPTDPNGVMLAAPSNGAYPVTFFTAGAERMRITGNGAAGAGTVGVNTSTPTTALEVSGTISATRFVGDGSGLTGIVGASNGDTIASGTTKVTANTTGYVSFTTGGTTTGYMNIAGVFTLPGVSSTGPISATDGYYSGNVHRWCPRRQSTVRQRHNSVQRL